MALSPIQASLRSAPGGQIRARRADFGIPRMVGGVDLDRRSDLGAVADHELDYVEDDAVEMEEHLVAEVDVVAIVAKDGGRIAASLPKWPKCSDSNA